MAKRSNMKRAWFLLPGLVLAGCQSGPITDSTLEEGPVFGQRDETRFVAGADGPVGAADLARIAQTIRKYKNLDAGEQEIIRRVASLKLEGLVASEMQRLAPRFEPRKQAVRQRTAQRVAAVRKAAAPARKPPAAVQQEVAQIESEARSELAAIDAEWRSAAVSSVTRRYGSDFALPVKTSDNKPVVALASLKGSGVQVASAAYEVGLSSAQLTAAAAQGGSITHDGRDVALLDGQAVLQ